MLKQIATNVWIGEQKQKYWGVEVGTRMTIMRLSDNQLSIVSPIKLDLRSIEEIEYFAFEGFRVFDFIKVARLNEIVFFHPESKTLILTDTAFHFDGSFPLATQLISQIIGGYRKEPTPPSKAERTSSAPSIKSFFIRKNRNRR